MSTTTAPPAAAAAPAHGVPVVQRGPYAEVVALAFDPQGRLLAALAGDRLDIWDVRERALRGSFPRLGDPQPMLSWSPDGHRIAVQRRGDVQILDLELGALLQPLACQSESEVSVVAWNLDSRTLATECGDALSVWDVVMHERLWGIAVAADTFRGPSFDPLPPTSRWSPDGQFLLTLASSKQLRIHDGKTGRVVTTLAHAGRVTATAWTRDGATLATATEPSQDDGDEEADGRDDDDGVARPAAVVQLWDRQRGTVRQTLTAPLGASVLVFDPAGTRLAASGSGQDAPTWLWSLPDGHRTPLAGSSPEMGMQWFANGALALGVGWEGKLWTGPPWQERHRYRCQGGCGAESPLAWAPVTDLVAATSDGSTQIWDASTGVLHAPLPEVHHRMAIMQSDDGRVLGFAHGGVLDVWHPTGQITRMTGSVAALTPDGARALTIGPDHWQIVDTLTTKVLASAKGDARDGYPGWRFTRDARFVFGVFDDHQPTIAVWSTADLSHVRDVVLPVEDKTSDVELDDGAGVQVVGVHGSRRALDLSTGVIQPLPDLPHEGLRRGVHDDIPQIDPRAGVYDTVMASPDGTRFLSTDLHHVQIWDPASKRVTARLDLSGVAASSGSFFFVTSGRCIGWVDDAVHLLRLESGQTLEVYDADPKAPAGLVAIRGDGAIEGGARGLAGVRTRPSASVLAGALGPVTARPQAGPGLPLISDFVAACGRD